MAELDLSHNIIAQLGLQSLPEEDRAALLEQMTQLVERRIMLRLMDEMTEEDMASLAELEGTPEDMLAFMSSKVPDMARIVQQETDKVKNEAMLAAAVDDGAAQPAAVVADEPL